MHRLTGNERETLRLFSSAARERVCGACWNLVGSFGNAFVARATNTFREEFIVTRSLSRVPEMHESAVGGKLLLVSVAKFSSAVRKIIIQR